MVEQSVDVLVLRVYEPHRHAPDRAARWLAAAHAHLPEALPGRFGDVEPLTGRLDRDGEAGFAAAYARADPLLFIAGKRPVRHASLTTPARRGVGALTLNVSVPPDDPRVRAFALALAHPGVLYLSASVAGGMIMDGGRLWGPARQPAEPYLAPLGEWLGLPPEPPSWCWFGPAYLRLLRGRVPGTPVAGGLLWTGGSWVPEPVRARLHEVDPIRRPAARMPKGVRPSLLSRLARLR